MTDKTKKRVMVPLDRVMAIAAKPAPHVYGCSGGRGQRSQRMAVYKQGLAILAHGEKLPVVIRNLSTTGCRIEYFQNIRLEGRILVTEPSIPLRQFADVVWQGEGASGVEFVVDENGE
jgi:hypothetical protein